MTKGKEVANFGCLLKGNITQQILSSRPNQLVKQSRSEVSLITYMD